MNSTIRRFAGGIGGQVATILLAVSAASSAGPPRFTAFTAAYLTGAGLCLAGAAVLVLG